MISNSSFGAAHHPACQTGKTRKALFSKALQRQPKLALFEGGYEESSFRAGLPLDLDRAYHGQALMKGPEDEQWYERIVNNDV